MLQFSKLSLKTKLVLMTWLVTLVALLLGFSFIIYRELDSSREKLIHEVQLSASLMAANSAAGLYFEDNPGVENVLSKLTNIPNILQTAVYDLKGDLFAYYNIQPSNLPPMSINETSNLTFQDNALLFIQPIRYRNKPLGFIWIKASTHLLQVTIKDYLITMVLLMLVLMLVTYIMASWFQKFISRPIIKLTEVTRKISAEGDYTTRVHKQSYDEIGSLYDGFNSMLNTIQDREQERNLARAHLEESRRSLNRAQQIAHIGSFTWNAGSRKVQFSDELYRIYGWPIPDKKIELTMNRVYSGIDPTDKKRVKKAIRAAIANGKSTSNEYRIIQGDRSKRWVRGMIVPQFDKSGKVINVSGIVQDITEQKAAEKALEQGEKRWSSFIDNSNDAIYLLYEGNFEMVNQRFLEMFEISEEELHKPDFNFMQLIDPQSYPDLETRDKKIKAGETVDNRYEFMGLTTSGRRLNLEVNVSYIPYKDGNAVQGFLRDITERVDLEDQLRQAQKMEAIGRLSGGIAHDFNNLLTIILGYSELAQVKVEPGHPVLKSIEQISKAGQRAEALTRQLLAFSRRQVIQPVVIDPSQLVLDLHKMLQRLIGEDLELIILPHENTGMIKADPGQMEQVILNLSVNARDAMPDGGKLTIEIRNTTVKETSKELPASQYVCIEVADNGVGMDKELQDQIFEPFFTTKEQGKGTGLGLSTVYGIVQQNNGSIQVNSVPGKGTTFQLYFPVVEREEISDTGMDGKETSLAGSERILLVEDVEGLRQLATATASERGYQVVAASHAQEALALFEEHNGHFDLLLTDVVMPGMNGKKLSELLTKKNPGLKVLFMSGYTDDAIVHHGILNDDISFIQKPFTPTRLLRKIRSVLDEEE